MRAIYKAFLSINSLVMFLAVPSLADESVLYDQAPPKDAVFVRLLDENSTTRDFEFNGHSLTLPAGTETAYAAISAQTLGLVDAGTFHSLLVDENGGFVAIEEPNERPNAKVHLLLINADDAPVRLIVPESEIEVVGKTAGMGIGSRAVNPIRTPLAAQRIDNGELIGTFDLSLSRGQNITFLVQNGQVTKIENRFGPVIEPAR
ncbi:MAG: hypothetical protein AAFR27_15705 [Pseudomonadota bacterium]